MDKDEFASALDRLGLLDDRNAAIAVFNVDKSTLSRWLAGTRGIPGPVVQLIAALEREQGKDKGKKPAASVAKKQPKMSPGMKAMLETITGHKLSEEDLRLLTDMAERLGRAKAKPR